MNILPRILINQRNIIVLSQGRRIDVNMWTLLGPLPIHGGKGKGGAYDIYHIRRKIKLGFFG